MALDFLNPETTLSTSSFAAADRNKTGRVATSADVTGVELRLLPPFIKDNRTPAVWPFPGFARLYCLTIVVSDAANQLVGGIDLKGFQRIGDREHLPINKTLFYWQSSDKKDKAPNQIHVLCAVIKSKKDLRDVGAILTQIKNDDTYKGLIGSLARLAKDAAKFSLATDIITQIAGIAGGYLGKVEDKPLGTVINSYTTLHGDFDKAGLNPFSYPTRNVDFQFQLVVRNAAAEKALVMQAKGTKKQTEAGENVMVDISPF